MDQGGLTEHPAGKPVAVRGEIREPPDGALRKRGQHPRSARASRTRARGLCETRPALFSLVGGSGRRVEAKAGGPGRARSGSFLPVPPSAAHCVTRSFARSLINMLTHSLTHSLIHSLTH